MDFLGLRNLTVLDDAVKMVQKYRPDFRLADIPMDDAAVFEMLSQGKTVTVIDASLSREAAANATLAGLSCAETLPARAAKSVTLNGASLLGLSEPWTPQLAADYVPVVCGVGVGVRRDA